MTEHLLSVGSAQDIMCSCGFYDVSYEGMTDHIRETAVIEGPGGWKASSVGNHGQVYMLISVYDRERGWCATKRSITYGGRHGSPPMIEDEADTIAVLELHNGLRAIRERLRKP